MTTSPAVALLVRFAVTGAWGPLAMNTPLHDITAAWGEASVDAPIGKRRAWPRLLSYGDVEVCVCDCRRVSLICVQTWRETVDLPTPDHGRLRTLPSTLTFDTVTEALTAARCPWTDDPKLTLLGQRALLAGPFGTSFVFEILEDGTVVLNVVGLHHPLHHCGPSIPSPGSGAAPAVSSSPP
jgi:hypothetical protein